MAFHLSTFEEIINPLDCVEDVILEHEWTFSRMNDDELVVEVAGKACTYRLFFIWQEHMGALQFCCQYDLKIQKPCTQAASSALMKINEELWMGHFDILAENGVPSFRHTCLLRGVSCISESELIEDLIEISMAQCERYYAAFHMLAQSGHSANDTKDLSLALMDPSGEA